MCGKIEPVINFKRSIPWSTYFIAHHFIYTYIYIHIYMYKSVQMHAFKCALFYFFVLLTILRFYAASLHIQYHCDSLISIFDLQNCHTNR